MDKEVFDNGGKKAFWHTASHIMAQAVKRLYPDVRLAIGPAIENGFYYDFDTAAPLTNEDLRKIEKEMKKIIKEGHTLEKFTLPREDALALMKDEPYKTELIRELPENEAITFYKQGEFTDLCAGPHLEKVSEVKAFRLMSVTGAYWRGNEKNKMLRRIYGIAFPDREALEVYLTALEEAKKRDHNKLGRELELFTTSEYIGQGLPILMPKGAKIMQILQRFVEDEEEKRGYQLTKTPFMAKSDLYKISGHWDHYREGMFVMGDADGKDGKEVFALRPMTCPFQFQAYLTKTRSYRDLPIRYNETSTLFRNEASGEMHGLIRLRQFTLSEGHIVCTPEQLEEEFRGCIDLAKYMLTAIGLDGDVYYRFSKWDAENKEKYIGSPAQWERVQDAMRVILDRIGIAYREADGEAAFYGPKLDIQIKNVHGKEDTLITIQIDFQLAERFEMEYTDADGQKKFPYIIHRSSVGCYERTLALLIEKFAGAFPAWLAPVQAKILPISEKHADYARRAEETLRANGFRVECDLRNEKIGDKIREAQKQKIPYMLVVGDKEAETETVAARSRKEGELGAVALSDFIDRLKHEVDERQA
ncbi:MAG: threonine--tRNA ligase [Clostridiales bacterium]|jgi:threonyl-tRNA synthetase|nr:threonine--tRNA ligase [Clostridiales bacterium]